MRGESVYAFPAKFDEAKWEAHSCKDCAKKERRDSDVRLHMVFQPRGNMSPIYPTDTDYTEVRAWDVALSKALYARSPYPKGQGWPEKPLACIASMPTTTPIGMFKAEADTKILRGRR